MFHLYCKSPLFAERLHHTMQWDKMCHLAGEIQCIPHLQGYSWSFSQHLCIAGNFGSPKKKWTWQPGHLHKSNSQVQRGRHKNTARLGSRVWLSTHTAEKTGSEHLSPLKTPNTAQTRAANPAQPSWVLQEMGAQHSHWNSSFYPPTLSDTSENVERLHGKVNGVQQSF